MSNLYRFLLLVLITLNSCKKELHEVLIEAESFKEKGGWIIDPQFVDQLDSPYLLAHGLGIPVKNAKSYRFHSARFYFGSSLL